MNTARIRPHKSGSRLEDLPLPTSEVIQSISESLSRQIDREVFNNKYASVKQVLSLIGSGAFVAASLAIPSLPSALRPFLVNPDEREAWKRFNIRYLKRTIKRLEKQKLIEIHEENDVQTLAPTNTGRRKILRYALDNLAIKKPTVWDGTWRLVSYDIPRKSEALRAIFREHLLAWRFFPLHESVYLHAYPCLKEISLLRDYLCIGEYVRLFTVIHIEHDAQFREFFGV